MLGLLVTVLHSDSRVPVWMPWVLLRKEVRRLVASVSGATRQNSGVAAACGTSGGFGDSNAAVIHAELRKRIVTTLPASGSGTTPRSVQVLSTCIAVIGKGPRTLHYVVLPMTCAACSLHAAHVHVVEYAPLQVCTPVRPS